MGIAASSLHVAGLEVPAANTLLQASCLLAVSRPFISFVAERHIKYLLSIPRAA